MIVVHHLENSRSQRVLWLLEELGVPYEVKRYERMRPSMLAPPELKQVHPLGKSPVITDGETTVAETGAIMEYLTAHYGDGSLRPPASTPAGRAVTYWLHYAEGSAMPPLLMRLIFSSLPARSPGLIRPIVKGVTAKALATFINPQINAHLAYWEDALGKSAWFAGEAFTAADIMMSFPLEATAARVGTGDYPKINAFLERIHARPAYQRALERGGPYGIIGG